MGKSLNGKELGVGISQRKDGLYQARFTNRFGKRKTLYNKKLNDLRVELRKCQHDNDEMINPVNDSITLDQWFEKWLDICKARCRESTKRTYITQYNQIREEIGYRKVCKITTMILQREIVKLRTANMQRTSKKILVDIFNCAMQADLIMKNPAEKIKIMNIPKEYEKEVLNAEEKEIFLKYAKHTHYGNLYIVALGTGMRIGELLGLKWEDINFETNTITIRRTLCYYSKLDGKYGYEFHHPKTNAGKRTIPMTSQVRIALKEQKMFIKRFEKNGKRAEGFEDLVFVTRSNAPSQQSIVQECIEIALKKIRKEYPNFKRISPHSLRHTFATEAIEKGISPKVLQKILGHKSLNVTMNLYCHVTDDNLFEQMKLLEQPERKLV